MTEQKKPEPEIIIYSTPTCLYCTMAHDYFAGKGLKFTEYDVSADEDKAREMVEKSGQEAVPVLQINGRILVGFNRELVEATLARPKPPTREEFLTNLFYDPFRI